jgi:hypothetical protein
MSLAPALRPQKRRDHECTPLRYEHYGSNTLHTQVHLMPPTMTNAAQSSEQRAVNGTAGEHDHNNRISAPVAAGGWASTDLVNMPAKYSKHLARMLMLFKAQGAAMRTRHAGSQHGIWCPTKAWTTMAVGQLAACYCSPSLAMAAASRSTWPEPYCCCPGAAAYAPPLCIHAPACSCFCCACSAGGQAYECMQFQLTCVWTWSWPCMSCIPVRSLAMLQAWQCQQWSVRRLPLTVTDRCQRCPSQ